MTDLAVRVEGLGKRYRIGAAGPRISTARQALTHLAAAPLRNLKRLRGLSAFDNDESADVIWALRDISFELKQGEVLGLIGRNGAGKSTLLKILSRITPPSTGFAEMDGRVGALLEVGTGFHPDLTGRENVYLNGSILGMDRRYIARRFEEIVEFAGVGKFIDTPVKRYSSGMHVRLAFAVAAHLEPDILIVDEVLAVGDAEFQHKCLGRMNDVAGEGRTVLFVSHNMNAVQRLCRRSIWLDRGEVVADGRTADIVPRYLSGSLSDSQPETWIDLSRRERTGSGLARFRALHFSGLDEAVRGFPYPGGPLSVRLRIHSRSPQPRASIAVNVLDQHGTKLINADAYMIGPGVALPDGESLWEVRIEELHLMPGTYQMGLWLADGIGEAIDRIAPAVRFTVIDRQTEQVGVWIDPDPWHSGLIRCDYGIRQVSDVAGDHEPRESTTA
jgi:lipopolysaccharide transport system ATP-binding protein